MSASECQLTRQKNFSHLRKVLVLDSVYFSSGILCSSLCTQRICASVLSPVRPAVSYRKHTSTPSDLLHPRQSRDDIVIYSIVATSKHNLNCQQRVANRTRPRKSHWHAVYVNCSQQQVCVQTLQANCPICSELLRV